MKIFSYFSSVNEHLKAFFQDLLKPADVRAGERFERLAKNLFPAHIYRLLEMTHSLNTNSERYVESSLAPDYRFGIRGTSVDFYIECKRRSNYGNYSKIDVFKEGQLSRYKSFKNSFLLLDTFIDDVEVTSLIPFSRIYWDSLFTSFISKYCISSGIIPSSLIIGYL